MGIPTFFNYLVTGGDSGLLALLLLLFGINKGEAGGQVVRIVGSWE